MTDLADIVQVYEGSNGEATKALYDRLTLCGTSGVVAMNLFRACKSSVRAKLYRGGNGKGSYRSQAYDKKQWSLNNLCTILSKDAAGLGIKWGWGIDEVLKNADRDHYHVIYIDIPTGQVSFHNGTRLDGPAYGKPWDGVRGVSVDRICRWVADVLASEEKSERAA